MKKPPGYRGQLCSGLDAVTLSADVVGVLNGKGCIWSVGGVDKGDHVAGVLEGLVGARQDSPIGGLVGLAEDDDGNVW